MPTHGAPSTAAEAEARGSGAAEGRQRVGKCIRVGRRKHKSIRELVRLAAASLPFAEPIYEFGALQVGGQAGGADLRRLFAGRTYVGCDMRCGPGVDRVLDLHAREVAEASVGSALCVDTLEHFEYPHRAVGEIHGEIHRALRPDGFVLLSSDLDSNIHSYPHDRWRFNPEAFRSVLRKVGTTSSFGECG